MKTITSKSLRVLAFAAAFIVSPGQQFAVGATKGTPPSRVGGAGPGGGHTVPTGQLLDTYENTGVTRLNPLEVGNIRGRLEALKTQLPAFHKDLTAPLEKNWYLEPKPMGECPGGAGLLDVKLGTGACQNRVDVRIKQNWFLSPQKSTEERQEIIFHELVRGMSQEKARAWPQAPGAADGEKEASLRNLARYLNQTPMAETKALQKQIAAAELGEYFSTDDLTLVKSRAEAYKEIAARLISLHAQLEEQGQRARESRSLESAYKQEEFRAFLKAEEERIARQSKSGAASDRHPADSRLEQVQRQTQAFEQRSRELRLAEEAAMNEIKSISFRGVSFYESFKLGYAPCFENAMSETDWADAAFVSRRLDRCTNEFAKRVSGDEP